MRSPRSVTIVPIAMPSRSLNAAIDLRALVITGFWPGNGAQFGDRAVHQLGVAGGFAHADVDRDLFDLRHRHHVLVAELFGERRHHVVSGNVLSVCCHVSALPYFLSSDCPHLWHTRVRRVLPPGS